MAKRKRPRKQKRTPKQKHRGYAQGDPLAGWCLEEKPAHIITFLGDDGEKSLFFSQDTKKGVAILQDELKQSDFLKKFIRLPGEADIKTLSDSDLSFAFSLSDFEQKCLDFPEGNFWERFCFGVIAADRKASKIRLSREREREKKLRAIAEAVSAEIQAAEKAAAQASAEKRAKLKSVLC